ncbi:MAG: M42 family peptidase [Desulfobacteraceae bacterium]|nr:MAG: M42 family peptidase [Desulfobacteraceae bacterium]
MDYALLTQLVETPGVSGREERVRDWLAGQLADISPETSTDPMGSLIGHIPGGGPRVALIAHMDEIGFLVSKVEAGGFVRVMPVGGVDARVFSAQKVIVHGRRDLPGIVGSIPPHLLKKDSGAAHKEALPIEESFIDLGLPADEILQSVTVGDPVTFATSSWQNEHAFFGKALDDRLGLFVMLSAIRQAAKIDCDLYVIASTQEEYGLRGAGPAVFAVKPNIVLALEGTVASDTPGLKLPANIVATCQGKGPEIRLSDRAMLSNRQVADLLIHLARQANIPHQVVVKNTGTTDATAGQTAGAGAKACTLSVPVRYIHAPVGIAQKKDIKHSVDLVAAFLEHAADISAP